MITKLGGIYRIGRVMSFFIVLFVIVYFLFLGPIDSRLERRYSNLSYSGIVTDKFIDKDNHSYRVIILNESITVNIPGGSYKIFEKIEIGDSLSKKKNELVGYLIKDDETLEIDYGRSIPD